MSKAIDTARWFVREGCDGDPEKAIQAIKDAFYCHKCGGLRESCQPKKRSKKASNEIAAFGDEIVCLTTVTVHGKQLDSGMIYTVGGVAINEEDVLKYYIKGVGCWADIKLFKKVKR